MENGPCIDDLAIKRIAMLVYQRVFYGILQGAFTPLTASGVWRAPAFTFSTRSFVSLAAGHQFCFVLFWSYSQRMSTCTNQRAIVTSLCSLASVPRKKAERRGTTHSGKPVFTLSSSFFVTSVLILWSSPHASEYGLHPLTNETKLWTWRYTKNIKEQYENNHYIHHYTSMQSSLTWMCVSSKNNITHLLGLHRGKSWEINKVEERQQVPKPSKTQNIGFTDPSHWTWYSHTHTIYM